MHDGAAHKPRRRGACRRPSARDEAGDAAGVHPPFEVTPPAQVVEVGHGLPHRQQAVEPPRHAAEHRRQDFEGRLRLAAAGAQRLELLQVMRLQVVEAGVQVFVNTLLAGMVGFMLAVGGVFLVEALDNTLRTPDDVTRALGLPVLGVIDEHDVEDGHLVALDTPRSPVAEAFRSLRTNIQFASVDHLVSAPPPFQ